MVGPSNINIKLDVKVDKLDEIKKLVDEASELTLLLSEKIRQIENVECQVNIGLKQDAK